MTCALKAALMVSAVWTDPTGGVAGDQPPEAAYVVAAMFSKRYDLKTGRFRAKGSKSTRDDHFMPIDSLPMEVFCAFDWPAGNFRFDSREPYPIVQNRPRFAPDGRSVTGTQSRESIQFVEVRAARTPEYNVDWCQTSPDTVCDVVLFPPHPSFRYGFTFHPFDARTLGMAGVQSFARGDTLEWLETKLANRRIDRVEHLPNGLIRLRTDHDFGFDQVTVVNTIDPERGYTALRLKIWQESDKQAGLEQPCQDEEVEWRQIAGVWVPHRYALRHTTPKKHESYELEFEWESVNEPVSDEMFSYTSFEGIPAGTRVVDRRSEEPVKIAVLGAVPEPPAAPPPEAYPHRFWILGIHLLLLIGIALFVVCRGRRRAV